MTSVPVSDDIDLYVWEGTSDLAIRADGCLLGSNINVIRADVAGKFRAHHDPARRTIALVSVSVMTGGRFIGSDWLRELAIPVIWVASEERGYDPRYYPSAYSYTLPLSFSCAELRSLLLKLSGQVADAHNQGDPQGVSQPLVAVSTEMQQVIADAKMYAGYDASVLVHGETGVGKERVARLLHEHSSRSGGPFVAVNCGAVPEGLFEAQFFGHAKGAFTGAVNSHKGFFEQAHQGTLFLDEVGELPLHQQVKLLRVLEQRAITRLGSTTEISVDFRIVVATHRNLRECVESGQFRADLYYRLVVVEIFVPNLEERGSDEKRAIFISLLGQAGAIKTDDVPEWLLKRVGGLVFSGNVRELSNLAERVSIVYARFGRWDRGRLEQVLDQFQSLRALKLQPPDAVVEITEAEQAERLTIIAALNDHAWRRQDTAHFLGFSRKVLWEKMRKYEITAENDLHRNGNDE